MSGIIGGKRDSLWGTSSGVIGTTELDYEEGEFTLTNHAGGSIASEDGRYIRIGHLCYYSISAINFSGGTGGVLFSLYGLPFTTATTHQNAASVRYTSVNFDATAKTQLVAYLPENGTGVTIYQCGDSVAFVGLTYADVSTSSEFRITGSYQIKA